MSYLSNYCLELPANLAVELLDLLRSFGGGLVLFSQTRLKHALEEPHPGGDPLRLLEEVGGNHKLIGLISKSYIVGGIKDLGD